MTSECVKREVANDAFVQVKSPEQPRQEFSANLAVMRTEDRMSQQLLDILLPF